jgi:hypothetical protein
MPSLPARQRVPPATIESLDRRPPREPEYPLGPELEDRITAPKQLILPRRRLRVENDRWRYWRRRLDSANIANVSLPACLPAYEVGREGRTLEIGRD